jgi:hypothetical protein
MPDTRPTRTSSQATASRHASLAPADATGHARSVLEKEGLIPPNGEVTAAVLAGALTRLTHNVPRMPSQATDGINAIATLLLSLEDSRLATRIAEKVSEALKQPLTRSAKPQTV